MKLHILCPFVLLTVLAACNDKAEPGCQAQVPTGAIVEREGDELAGATSCPDAPDSTLPNSGPVLPGGESETPPSFSTVPREAALFSSEVNFTNFDSADREKVQRALDLIRQVVQTEEFRDRVLNHRYNGARAFSSTTKTNAQVYQALLDGAETLRPSVDHEMDLELELYTNNSNNVVGYTYPNVLKIWMNTKYFNQYEPCEVARNLIHEWTHKLGYGHDSDVTARRPYSVPYAVGSIVQDIACEL